MLIKAGGGNSSMLHRLPISLICYVYICLYMYCLYIYTYINISICLYIYTYKHIYMFIYDMFIYIIGLKLAVGKL